MYDKFAMFQINGGRLSLNADTERRHMHLIKLIQQHLYNSNDTFVKYSTIGSTCNVSTTQILQPHLYRLY